MDIEKIISEMSVQEKAALVSGTDFMYTNPIPRLGVPSLCMSDDWRCPRCKQPKEKFNKA